jgi:hypothetical protein
MVQRYIQPVNIAESLLIDTGYIDKQPYPNNAFKAAPASHYNCTWLLKLPEYTWWKQEESAVLLLYGGIGVGKTALLEYSLRLAQSQSTHSRSLVVSLLCGNRADQRLELADLWKQLQYQLAVQMGEFPRITDLIRNAKSTGDAYLAQELLSIGLGSCGIQIYIDLEDQEAIMGNGFLNWLSEIYSKFGPGARLQIMIATRCHDTGYHSGFSWKRVLVHSCNKDGIEDLVEMRLKTSTISYEVKQNIIAKSRGNFMWTNLVLKSVPDASSGGFGLQGIRHGSDTFRDVLKHRFNSSMFDSSSSSSSWRAWLYAWLMHAPEPLTTVQLAATFALWWCMRHEVDAITVISDAIVMAGLTNGLVHLDRQEDHAILELVHPAARDYIHACGWVDDDTEREYLEFPFRWLEHATSSPNDEMLQHTFTQYTCQHFPSLLDYFASYAIAKPTYLRLFQEMNWDHSIRCWLEAKKFHNTTKIDLAPDSSTKLVHIAASCGSFSILSNLKGLSDGASLQTRAHLDIECQDSLGRTPLALAKEVKDDNIMNLITNTIEENKRIQEAALQHKSPFTKPVAVRAFTVGAETSSSATDERGESETRPHTSEKLTKDLLPQLGSMVAMPGESK